MRFRLCGYVDFLIRWDGMGWDGMEGAGEGGKEGEGCWVGFGFEIIVAMYPEVGDTGCGN